MNLIIYRNIILHTSVRYAVLSSKALEKLGLPMKPKKPATPYIRFLKTIRPKIVESHPQMSAKEAVKIIAEQWKTCSPELKEQYQKDYLLEKEQFIKNIQEYNDSITEEQKQMLKDAIIIKKQAVNFAKIKEVR